MTLHKLTLQQAHEGLKKKEFSSVELTQSCFERIHETEPSLHCLLTTAQDQAMEQARAVDARIAQGEEVTGLMGVPATIKDILVTKGITTTAASKQLEHYTPLFDAEVVSRLKGAGAIVLGKNNLDAWAHGSSTENSDFGPSKNPWDLSKVPGGSSGGSAASVAADQCFYSIGTDTGGSIRQPASFCGVVGVKPTYGRVSRFGSIAMGSSLDTIGPLTKTVYDAALVLQAIAGKDAKDATTVPREIPDYVMATQKSPEGLRIGVPKQVYAQLPEATKEVFDASLERMRSLGVIVEEIDMTLLEYGIATYYIIMPSEVSSNLGRYDGVRYGFRDEEAQTLMDMYTQSRSQGLGDEAKRRIMIGTYVLSAGYYDAYYKKAMKVRTLIKQEFENIFASFDAIAMPTALGPAFGFSEKIQDPLAMYLEDIFTVTANIAGVPGMSVPAGLVNGLPVGLQLLAPQFKEETLFSLGYAFEKSTVFEKKLAL